MAAAMTSAPQRDLKARNLRLALMLLAVVVALFAASFFVLPGR